MDYEDNKRQYEECHFCGEEKKCFAQVKSDEEYIVCPICLPMGDDD